jgi:hypothetical protein
MAKVKKVKKVKKVVKKKKDKSDGHWIAGAIKHPGALRKELHVPKGSKIPLNKLRKVSQKKGIEGKRARLAETLRGFKKRNK